MIVVVASTEADEPTVRRQLAIRGVVPTDVVDAGGRRLLVRAVIVDERAAWALAADLRAAGFAAVSRPERGAALAAWERDTAPVVFGDRLTVCHACSEHDREGLPGLVEVGPGGFGTGRHLATRLIVETLVDRIQGGERLLDVGCGSGVLGLSALRLGAAEVVAIDVDATAVEATRRSAALNGMSERLTATATPLAEVEDTFDIVVANVARAAAVELAPELSRRVAAAHGWLAVSGLSPPQCDLLNGFLPELEETERRLAGDWAMLLLATPAPASAHGDPS